MNNNAKQLNTNKNLMTIGSADFGYVSNTFVFSLYSCNKII